MSFSLLTYNVLFNKAYPYLLEIIEKYHPDILCLQEVDTNEKNLSLLTQYGYKLADYSNSFIKFGKIFGVATFYNPNVFRLLNSKTIFLSRNIIEVFLDLLKILLRINQPKTVLQTHLIHKTSKKTIVLFNVHFILLATNALRINYIKQIFNSLDSKKKPLIIAGDFNYYPYGRKKLENTMKLYKLKEATSNIDYTIQFSEHEKLKNFNFLQRLIAKIINKIFIDRLKIDYIFYRGLKLKETKKIDVRFSDHYPIISIFEC